MSKDKIEVNMNVYDIPILVEALEEANKEIERLHSIIKEVREYIEDLAEDTGDYIGAIDRRRKVELLEMLDKVGETNVKDKR